MNKEQRKFLSDRISKEAAAQMEAVRESIPEKPSLNNYMVAAFLDGTAQLRTVDEIKDSIRKTVLAFGASDTLVHDGGGYRNSDKEGKVEGIMADELFVLPQAYLDKLQEWKEVSTKAEAEMKKIRSIANTLEMKIQIGSNEALVRLVDQIDNIGDLQLVNNQLLLK